MTEFEQLYNSYFSDVYRYIQRLSGDAQVAEEITSDTFFKAMQAIHKFRGDCDVRVWLCQIAKNCYYSYRKKTEKNRNKDLTEIPDDHSGELTELLIHQEEAEQIREILHGVPEPYKEVFMWRVFAQLNFRQIGSIFGKNENWACVTYHRARKMIRQRLEEREL